MQVHIDQGSYQSGGKTSVNIIKQTQKLKKKKDFLGTRQLIEFKNMLDNWTLKMSKAQYGWRSAILQQSQGCPPARPT